MRIYLNATQAKVALEALRSARANSSNAYAASRCGELALMELMNKIDAAMKAKAKP